MKTALVKTDSDEAVAVCVDGRWFDFTNAYAAAGRNEAPRITRIEQMLAAGMLEPKTLAALAAQLDEQGLVDAHSLAGPPRFLAPVRPGKIVALGRNYAAHAAETGFEPPAEPIIFSKSPTSCIGDGDAIVIEPGYGRVDHEVELAVIIGRRAKNIEPEAARRCIAGYTIVNDITERDMQKVDIGQGHPWFRSKSFDTFCPIGPVLALPDEMPWPVTVDLELKVNGEVRQKSNTSRFIFDIPGVLAFITRHMTLEPGDVVSTGTPEGISPIKPGDIVEARIPEIGVLRNPVITAGAG